MPALSPVCASRVGLGRGWGMLCLRPANSPAEPQIVKSRLVVLAVLCAALAGCGHMPKIWPFYKKAKPGPEVVNELNLVNADGSAASYPQYWSRNTLVIDLSGVS